MFNDFRRTVTAGLAAAATALVLGASASAQNASTWGPSRGSRYRAPPLAEPDVRALAHPVPLLAGSH